MNAMIGRGNDEIRSSRTARVQRRSSGVQTLRRRSTGDSFRSTFHACSTRACVQKEVRSESESTRTKAKSQAFGLGPRRPARPGLVDGFRFSNLAGEFRISEALASDLTNTGIEALSVTHLPIVVAERLFVDIAEQLERFDAHVGAVQSAFQQAPEVFHGVGVDFAVRVLDRVVDDGVLVVFIQAVVGKKFIAENRRSSLDVLTHLFLNRFLASVIDYKSTNIAAALDHAHNDGLVFPASPGDDALTLRP